MWERCRVHAFTIGTRNGRGVVTRAAGEGGDQERELAEQYRNWEGQRSPSFPFVANILNGVADEYERQAKRQDDEVSAEQRLGN